METYYTKISMNKYVLAIDNGVTGSLAILGPDSPFFDLVPTKEYLMGKAGKVVRRIDHDALSAMISLRLRSNADVSAYVERPFTGGPMFVNVANLSARAHEAVLITLERLGIGTQTIDSKEWQVPILGNVKGSPALKHASMLRGIALYPQFLTQIKKHGDADGLLMAHHYHRTT